MVPTLAFFAPGPMEFCIIGFIAVLLFGKRLPGIARAVGSSMNQFKAGLSEIEDAGSDVADTLKNEANDVNNAVNS